MNRFCDTFCTLVEKISYQASGMPQGLKSGGGGICNVGVKNWRGGRDVRAGPKSGGVYAPLPTSLYLCEYNSLYSTQPWKICLGKGHKTYSIIKIKNLEHSYV